MTSRVLPAADTLPVWLDPVVAMAQRVQAQDLTRFPAPASGGRPSAVLILMSEGVDNSGPDVLLIERAHDMRAHSGQPAFPGGAVDPDDADAVATALREAVEETGLDPAGVVPFATLPELYLPPSGFVVTPVLAWWAEPSSTDVVDPREVASIHRVPWSHLVDPAFRASARHPSGYVGAAFLVGDLVVWGFTGGLIDRIIALCGWEVPWDRERIVPVREIAPPPAAPPQDSPA